MSSTIKAKTDNGIVTSAIRAKWLDDSEQLARTKMLLSIVHALKEATYLICGLLALLMLYSWACERDLAEHNLTHQETRHSL